MMGWLIALGVLILIGFIPLGVIVWLQDGRLVVRARVSFIRITVVGGEAKEPKKPKRERKAKKEKPKKETAETDEPEKKSNIAKTLVTNFDDVQVLLKLLMRTLGRFVRGLRINRLRLIVVMASDDAAKTVWTTAALSGVTGMVYPWLKSHLRLHNDRISYRSAFDRTKPEITFFLNISITIGRLLAIVLAAVAAFLRFMIRKRTAAMSPRANPS